jgi:hypothetical protein
MSKTDKQILALAIQKAIDGGWVQKLIWIHGNVKDKNVIFMKALEIDSERIYWAYDEYISVSELIFNHDFAKALWGEGTESELVMHSGGLLNYKSHKVETYQDRWQYHLQRMVIADNPIQYLGENL